MRTGRANRRQFMAMAGAAALIGSGRFSAASAQAGYDLVIKGGRVIDPAAGVDTLSDLAISGGRIAAIHPEIVPGAARVLDAEGKLVVPGLIDIHTHGTIDPTSAALMLADGVTGWIEAGWQGAETVEQGIAALQDVPQKAGLLLNIGRKGVTIGTGETKDLDLADVEAARAAIAANREYVVGVKARLSQSITSDHDLEVLRRAIAATEPFGIPVMIHMGATHSPLGALLDLMRPGDIVTHIFAPPPHAIVDDAGMIIPEARAARERGVIFDWGHGTREHVVWDIAQAAVDQGFLPDTLSSDWTVSGFEAGLVAMPTVMSGALSLGIELNDVIAMATCNAAAAFPLFEGLGTLAEGSSADVAVMELHEGEFEFGDTQGTMRAAVQRLANHATVLRGEIVVPDHF